MSSTFTPVPLPPSASPQLFPTPIQIVPPVSPATRATASDAERWFGFGTPEGRAWAMLLLRAAYLDDFQFSVTAAGFKDGLVNAERFQGPAFGTWRITLLEYLPAILCCVHGVRDQASITSVAADLTTPRYSAGGTQFLQTAATVGDAILDVLDGGRWSAKPRAAVGHSFGGPICAWMQAKPPSTQPFVGIQTFGACKIGQANAADAIGPNDFWCYGAMDDPIIGFPPSFIRLQLVPQLLAIWPVMAAAAAAVKRRIDGIWTTLRSITSAPQAIDDNGNLSAMSDVDNGRAWYARNGGLAAGLFDIGAFEAAPGHQARVYYDRCRAGFPTWTTLNAQAGPAGRNADLLALALSAAEAMEEP